jgi:Holliday junction resolvase
MVKLRAEGWVVYRAAGSHGYADLVALRAGDIPMLVQVKTDVKGPFDHFRPEERRALREEAERAGAQAMLCHWPARKAMTMWHVDVWP